MTFRPFLFLALFLLAAPASAQAPAQTRTPGPDDGQLHILRPALHAEQDKAELCLEFDRALEDDFSKAVGAIKLSSGGKPIVLSPQNLGVNGNVACISNLEHRKTYRLSVGDLRGENGEKLNEAYRLSFTVPDRKPSLAFLSDLYGGGLLRWQENDPTLRAVNVSRAKVELYRIEDAALMAEGWRQRLQTTLAPSESAYFARNKGRLLWQGEIVLENAPNKTVEQKVPARAALQLAGLQATQPGLYLIVASMTEPKAAIEKDKLAPLAASWLLRSDLRAHAVRGSSGFYGLAEKADATGVLSGVKLDILDGNQQSLAEGKTDASGTANIPLPDDKMQAAQTLIASDEAGDTDFVDLTQGADNNFLLGGLDARINLARDGARPGDNIEAVFSARDLHGKLVSLPGSRLVLLYPDRSFYAQYPLPKNENDAARLAFPAPAENGAWILSWQKPNGEVLAEAKLRVSPGSFAPRLTAEAGQSQIGEDGALTLTVKSTSAGGKPAIAVPGRVFVSWAASKRAFPGWEAYSFGGSEDAPKGKESAASFVTGEDGLAQVRLHLDAPSGDGLYAASIKVTADPATGASNPEILAVPFKPRDIVVGIRPLAEGGRFAENGIARFDIVALDPEGRRVAADNLHYQIFEEGRSFDWYQDQGKWNYTPQQQRRSAGGGTLSLKAEGANSLDWPVNAGNYSLEIAGPDRKIMARVDFTAGWDSSKPALAFAPLAVSTPQQPLHVGEPAHARFRLDTPAVVTAIIADDHIREILHEAMPPGDNDFAFTPSDGWGNDIALRIEARGLNPDGSLNRSAASAKLALAHSQPAPVLFESAPPLAIEAQDPPALQPGDALRFEARLKNDTLAAGTYRYAFTGDAGLKLSGNTKGDVKIGAGHGAMLAVTLSAPQAGSHELRLELSGPRNAHLARVWPVAVAERGFALGAGTAQILAPRQSATLAPAKNATYVFVAPAPLYRFPQILARAVHAPVFATADIAAKLDVIRLWRGVIAAADLAPESWLAGKQRNLALRLLARQSEGGGFAGLPGGEADIASTSAALAALAPLDLDFARPALDRASDYLRQRLGNNWFDESERPQRAAAYAALAAAGRLDAASLQHFSDDSASGEKNIPPLASARLAYAFAKNNEPEKSAYWLKRMGDAAGEAAKNPALLPVLAGNAFFDAGALSPALEKISDAGNANDDAAFLTAEAYLQERAGSWKLVPARGEQSLHGIFALARAEKSAALALRNPGDNPLYVNEASAAETNAAPVARSLYRLNGEKIAVAAIRPGETYLVLLEAAPVAANADILIHDNPGPALAPSSCALDDAIRGDAMHEIGNLAFMRDMPLSPFIACDKTAGAIDILMVARGETAKTLRAAYFAEAAWQGNFRGSPPRLVPLPRAVTP